MAKRSREEAPADDSAVEDSAFEALPGASAECSDIGKDEAILERARARLVALCASAGINDSHGIKHAMAVLRHAEKAIEAAEPSLSSGRALSVRLAALLHDADDRKYFGKECAEKLTNASKIMVDAGVADDAVVADTLEMISLVSCSKNGNTCPPRAHSEPELLFPRWADRLEAAGEIGVARCYLHNLHAGDPLSVESTPRPTNEAEAFKLATEERFADYQRRGGSSASMIDHYFDKLLQVARPHPSLVRNGCTCRAIEQRGNCMRRPCHRPSYHQGTYLILLLLLLRFCRLAASPNPVMMLRAACSRLSSTSHPPPPSPQTSRRRHATVCVRYWTSC